MSDIMSSDQGSVLPSTEHDAPIDTTQNSLYNAKDTVVNSTQSAFDAVNNHPVTQNVKDTFNNAPITESVKQQSAKTTSELSALAASRTTPAEPAATGQQLTHYHSFFYSLLSWKNPRASGIAYLATIAFIFVTRYLDVLRYAFKLTYMTLGITVFAEILGKSLFKTGLTSQVRPAKYYTLSKDTLDNALGDVHELINFFVIESQRIVFAENIGASIAAFIGAFLSYWLVKIVPYWGLALISTSVLFIAPLIYKTNKEFIDEKIETVTRIANEQAEQVKKLAGHHAAKATEATKGALGEYSAKAQGLVANARGRSVSPLSEKKEAPKTNGTGETSAETSAYKSEDFPAAPTEQFKSQFGETNQVGETDGVKVKAEDEPLLAM